MLFVFSFLHLCKHLSFWHCQHLIAMSLSYKKRKKPNRSKLGMLINLAPESQRSWVRFLFKPEFFQVSSFQPLRLKHLHCDDLHLILHLFMFSHCQRSTTCTSLHWVPLDSHKLKQKLLLLTRAGMYWSVHFVWPK